MNRPLDPTRPAGRAGDDPAETDDGRTTEDKPSKEAVEEALARLVDAVLPDSRPGKRGEARRRKVRRAS